MKVILAPKIFLLDFSRTYFSLCVSFKKKITSKKASKLFDEKIENLKGVVFKCLKSSTSKSPTVIKKVEISMPFSNF